MPHRRAPSPGAWPPASFPFLLHDSSSIAWVTARGAGKVTSSADRWTPPTPRDTMRVILGKELRSLSVLSFLIYEMQVITGLAGAV